MNKIFNTTNEKLTKYNGTSVKIIEDITNTDRDPDIKEAYVVEFYDGVKSDAFGYELS